MISLNIFTDLCNWWWLAWLLPFILGLSLGWAIWSKFAKKSRLLEDELATLRRSNRDIDSRLDNISNEKQKLISELDTSKRKIKDLEKLLTGK